MGKILVVTSCTGEKKYNPENKLFQKDFLDKDTLKNREEDLKEFSTSAADMYTGMQHLRLMEGINLLRQKFGNEVLDLAIVSAGYGLIDEDREVVPYEVTFNDMSASEVVEWSKTLKIQEALQEKIKDYTMIIFLLGDKYLRALRLPLGEVHDDQKLVFLASGTSKKLIPSNKQYHFLEVGQEDAKSFSYGLVGLKGYLFKMLAQEVVESGINLFDKIYENPQTMMEVLNKYRKNKVEIEQIELPIDIKKVEKPKKDKTEKKSAVSFFVAPESYAKNFGNFNMKYFIPEWDDRVDPKYDFLTDTATENRNPYLDDVYAHEIYDTPNYDGILISKIVAESSKNKKALMQQMGVHDFVRFSQNKPMMGDCGAFGYIDEYEPPYTTDEILNYYESLGFNIGVSIDHLIVGKIAQNVEERERRYKITRNNAADFIKKYKEGSYSFIPSGVAQGWDPKSYRDSVANLIDMGYKHISIGGLVRTTTKDIISIQREIAPIITEDVQMHLFGVARVEAIDTFRKLGITAFDSASHLRRAWLGSGSNYFAMDGNRYAALRVPPVDGHGVKVKKMVAEGRGTIERFKELEVNALNSLRSYDKGKMNLDDTLNAVLAYDELIDEDRDKNAELYRKVLEDQPWKKCGCKICNEIGIDVIIFRGNNRNRRRGFHNTYVFYNQFKNVIK